MASAVGNRARFGVMESWGCTSCAFIEDYPPLIPPPIQAFRLSGGGFSSVFICLLFPLTELFKCFEVVSEHRQPDLSIGPLRRSTGNPLEATMRLEVRKPSLHGAPSVPVFLLGLGSLHSLLQSIDRLLVLSATHGKETGARLEGNPDAASYNASRRIGWPSTPYFADGVPRGLARPIRDGSIRLAWATLPTDGVLQIKCLDRLPDPFIVTEGDRPEGRRRC